MSDHGRAIRNTVAYGSTTAPVQVVNGVAHVQVQLTPIEVLTMPVVEMRGLGANMPVGTPVVAMFHNGDRSNGVIIGSTSPGTSPSARPSLAGPEDMVLYGYGFAVRIAADGLHITGAPDVFIDGNLHVNGEVTAKAQGGSVTLSQHTHPANNTKPNPNT